MPLVEVTTAFVCEYIAGHALDGAARALAPAAKLFVDKTASWLAKTYTDRYVTLDGPELLAFYSNERPLAIGIGGRNYVLAASLLHRPITGGLLSAQLLQFTQDSGRFAPPSSIDAYVASTKARIEQDRRLWDGKVIRLAALQSNEARIQPASYFDSLATNFAMDNVPSGRAESLRQFSQRRGSLGDLHSSPLVNHIGVVCMVETADGMIVAQHRSKDVALRPRSTSASVSGVLHWDDIARLPHASGVRLDSMLQGALREAEEELGTDLHDCRYLGLIREFQRGGKPELYFFAKSLLSFHQIETCWRKAKDRSESISLLPFEFHSARTAGNHNSLFQFQERVGSVLERADADANFTFTAGVLLSANHVLAGAT